MTIVEDAASSPGKEAALVLHRAGKLDRARTEYERLLASAPADADLLGLLGVLALQQQLATEAETLLRRAIHPPHRSPRIHLRNVNNLFVLFREQERTDAAADLAGVELPDWPADAPPDAAEQARLLSLGEALALAGRPERGAALLESALAHPSAEVALCDLAGRLRLECGEAAAAVQHLQRACASERGSWQALAALSNAHGKLGQQAQAWAAARQCGEVAPVYLAPRRTGQRATILVLNPAPEKCVGISDGLHGLHFTTNFIAQASNMMAREYRFASVFTDLADPTTKLPEADLIFNNMGGGETMSGPGRSERVEALIGRIGRPVINHPAAVQQMTRQKVADLLRGIPGLRVPRIERYWRDMARFDEIEAHIASAFTYPVIVRHTAADESSKSLLSERKTAILVRDRGELRSFLGSVAWSQFYVIEYIDLRKPDGNYRKLRAAFFPDEIVLVTGAHYKEWMVGGWRAVAEGRKFYEAFPHLIGEMNSTLLEPEATLGSGVTPVLEAIRSRIPLEVFGMDFDLNDAGEIVLFEVGATMNFHPRKNTDVHLRFPQEPGERVDNAFRRLVQRRMARHPPAVSTASDADTLVSGNLRLDDPKRIPDR